MQLQTALFSLKITTALYSTDSLIIIIIIIVISCGLPFSVAKRAEFAAFIRDIESSDHLLTL